MLSARWSVSNAHQLLLLCLAVLLAPSAVLACDCKHADFIQHLPGWNQPLPSPWYSGYLTYDFEGRTVHTHYILVQAEDDFHDTKPLIYWTNGGPGASSMFGLLTELGPLLLNDDSLLTADYRQTGIPSLQYNPTSWSRLGSVLMFDQPAPIGFSYCNDDTDAHDCAKLSWTDELASANAYAALQAFYKKFSCYQDKELYVTGESYGGIYVPTLVRRILQDTANNNITLAGFAVGDGCLGTKTGICSELGGDNSQVWKVLFLFGHGQIPINTFHQYMKACGHDHHPDVKEMASFLLRGGKHAGFAEYTVRQNNNNDNDDMTCDQVLKLIDQQAGGYFAYNLYDDCTYRNGLQLTQNQRQKQQLNAATNDYACGGILVMENWLALTVVQKALHVVGSYFSVDNAVNFDYTPTEPDLRGFYKSLLLNNMVSETPVRVLIYNGDTDPAITSMAAQNWTWHLGLPETESWRPWTVDGCQRMGGYVTRYQGDLDFLTIRGAGHMVPTYKAEATFTFFKAWIENKDYPLYVKDCKAPSPAARELTL